MTGTKNIGGKTGTLQTMKFAM